MAVTRDQLVETAILVLDEAGLAGLTLRQVAARLGVQAPALYWHVRNKRELLDLMAEAIVAQSIAANQQQPAPGQAWWEWLAERTQAICESLRAHPDSAQVIAGNRPTWKTLPQIEQLLGILVGVGFPPVEALQAVLALGNLVTGCVLEEQASASRPADPERDEAMREELLGSHGRFPILTQAATGHGPNGPDTFEYALRLMIAGLRGRHAELRAAARSRPDGALAEMADAVAGELAGAALGSVLRDLADPANLPKRPRSADPRP
jgi:TetR/AcrR family tetracycline transcriptional repressor